MLPKCGLSAELYVPSVKIGSEMKVFLLVVLIVIAVLIVAYLYRVIQGPTVYDRVLGLNAISTKAIILLVVVGTVYGRVDMFVDISTGYALLNLVGSLAIVKYLEEGGKDSDAAE